MKVVEVKNTALTVGLSAILLTILACSSSGTTASSSSASASPSTGTTSPRPGGTSPSSTSPTVDAAQNAALDFTLVNSTGYGIKALYIGASGTGDWTKEDEILKGKAFKNGDQLEIKFHPKATAEKWDIMVSWDDGSGNVEWLSLKLTEITKITLHYNKETDKTTATID